jgi:hypothetical protein
MVRRLHVLECLRDSKLRRFGNGWLFALLLATSGLTTAAEVGSTLRYDHGNRFQTDLLGAHLLGELHVPGQAPILLFSGQPPDAKCPRPYCDPKSTVFFESASSGPSMWTSMAFRYPGDYYVSANECPIARVRMFVGNCLDSREVAVWFIQKVSATPTKDASVWHTRVAVSSVHEKLLTLVEEDLATNMPEISVARAAVSRGVCTEISPIPRLYNAADAYAWPAIPKLRTDCHSPAPDPAKIPLAPGPAGKSISYLDKKSGTLFYVESDGRHLAALSPLGDLLWVRNPFVDKNLCPYRLERPIIARIEAITDVHEAELIKIWKREGPFLEIYFNSSQFGAVDIKTGDFLFEGQN